MEQLSQHQIHRNYFAVLNTFQTTHVAIIYSPDGTVHENIAHLHYQRHTEYFQQFRLGNSSHIGDVCLTFGISIMYSLLRLPTKGNEDQ